MSGNDRHDGDGGGAELRSFRELESLVRNLGEELATFRRRALAAETQLKEAPAPAQPKAGGRTSGGTRLPASAGVGRGAELEAENEALRVRLAGAAERVRQMLDRVRFLRQQVQLQAAGAGVAGTRTRS